MAKLTIGLEYVKRDEGYLAAAVIYHTDTPAPIFEYRDERGVVRRTSLRGFWHLAEHRQLRIMRHVQFSALSWAVVRGSHLTKSELLGLVAARALEKYRHKNPDEWSQLENSDDIEILHTLKQPLPARFLDAIPEQLLLKRVDDWHVCAAYVLAKHAP